jgi:hypothetical protein
MTASIYNEAPSLFTTVPFPLPLPFFASALISERKAMLFSDFAPLPVVSDLNLLMTAPTLESFVLSTSSSNNFSALVLGARTYHLNFTRNIHLLLLWLLVCFLLLHPFLEVLHELHHCSLFLVNVFLVSRMMNVR